MNLEYYQFLEINIFFYKIKLISSEPKQTLIKTLKTLKQFSKIYTNPYHQLSQHFFVSIVSVLLRLTEACAFFLNLYTGL